MKIYVGHRTPIGVYVIVKELSQDQSIIEEYELPVLGDEEGAGMEWGNHDPRCEILAFSILADHLEDIRDSQHNEAWVYSASFAQTVLGTWIGGELVINSDQLDTWRKSASWSS